MDKILSIIIPTYNMEKYLRKCLDSLIISDENMEKIEVLVINDGSKDSSSVIAHEYESRYPQTIKVIDKDDPDNAFRIREVAPVQVSSIVVQGLEVRNISRVAEIAYGGDTKS